jgi:hypothetical protein
MTKKNRNGESEASRFDAGIPTGITPPKSE